MVDEVLWIWWFCARWPPPTFRTVFPCSQERDMMVVVGVETRLMGAAGLSRSFFSQTKPLIHSLFSTTIFYFFDMSFDNTLLDSSFIKCIGSMSYTLSSQNLREMSEVEVVHLEVRRLAQVSSHYSVCFRSRIATIVMEVNC